MSMPFFFFSLLISSTNPMQTQTHFLQIMEPNNSGGSGGSPVTSRWNPTKEQIGLLENLYMQGIRTPNAEQIQEITSRLKAYGHIEGKNVFYWFQNHKARQRQKLKQDNLAYINRYLHQSHPVFHPNVVCSPYFVPQTELVFYPRCPKMILPTNLRRKSRIETLEKARDAQKVPNSIGQETLSLFPLHPIGKSSMASTSVGNSESLVLTNSVNGIAQQPFFDFFSGSATS